MTKDEIKPCPFCCHTPIAELDLHNNKRSFIRCECGANVGRRQNIEEAIKAWNTRVKEPLRELNNKEVLSFINTYLRNTGKSISEYSSVEECITYFALDLIKKFGTKEPLTNERICAEYNEGYEDGKHFKEPEIDAEKLQDLIWSMLETDVGLMNVIDASNVLTEQLIKNSKEWLK